MAYVNPNGTIELMRGVNLDNRYMHTLYFANTEQQTAFFNALVSNSFTSQSYTRPHRGCVRLRVSADSVMDVTYMRFNNNRTVSRWFYAFVTSVNYVNENTTDITYEIDVMQTWFVQNNNPIQPCYVEREHVAVEDDTIVKQLEPEPFGSEIYDFTEITTISGAGYQTMEQIFSPSGEPGQVISSYSFVLNTTAQPNASHIYRDGIINGTKFLALDPLSSVQIISAMEAQLGSWDKQEQSAEIVDMFMFPTYFAGQMDANTEEYFATTQPHSSATVAINHPKKYSNYVPQNKKLYGYPFAYLYVTTMDGDAGEYRWEYFEGDVTSQSASPIEFELNACCSGGGSIEMHPRSYNGVEHNTDCKVVMNNFPKCTYSYDAYQAFVAAGGQTKLLYQANMAEKKGMNAKRAGFIKDAPKAVLAGAAAVGAAAAVPAGAGLAAIGAAAAPGAISASQITGSMTLNQQMAEYKMDEALHKISFQFSDANYEPNITVGGAVPNIAVGAGYLCYKFYHAHIRDDEMVKVDNYLSIYGYAVNNVKKPILTGRPYWNFLKTRDCVISGNMPASSKAAIASIIDGGIFFWNSSGVPATVNSNIGNFTRNVNSHGQIVNR